MQVFDRLSLALASPRRFALLAVAWTAGLGWIRPLAVPDEGRYTDIARWMGLSGDWLQPRLNGLPFLEKPPLYFWLEGIIIQIAGAGVLAARVVSLAAALSVIYAVYRFARTRLDEQAARWSAIVLATSPLFFGGAQFANLDMLICACITWTVLLAVEAAEAQGTRARRLWLAAYVAAALGVLAKGLIGIVIPGMVFVAWSLAARRPRWILAAIDLRGMVLLALITVPWFALVENRVPGFLRYFFVHHHFERYAETGFNNPRGVWFFPAVVLGGMLPWAIALVPGLRSALAEPPQRRRIALFGLTWSLVVVAFFSVPRSKLAGYIFPALPALAILIGPWIARWPHRRLAAATAAAICIAAVPAALLSKELDQGRLASDLRGQIAAADRVVFWNGYFFSVPVILQRTRAVEVVGDWTMPSPQLPDNWRRELTAGKEFEPASAAGVLISPADFRASLSNSPARVWVWVHKAELKKTELSDFEIVRERGEYAVLRQIGRQP
jgi:4-amino-4-deoxy-L-arabinose transferase-like glycosyltransferase